ncbi:TonB-dependent receptor [Beijerinckia indica subsp. indica ATCC 9039]|uniref:TonB-dependent receptor n=2 Tax=Beijerinckia TaxID=532 RepID=B2IDN4_BEII9|nr:TonB-dependent receptor [Beijerinckia indica subsp. indica ATCC 9039]
MRRGLLSSASIAPFALGILYIPLAHPVEAAAGMHQHGASQAQNEGSPQDTAQGAAQDGTVQDVVVVGEEDRGEQKMEEVMMHTPRSGDVVTGKQAQEQQFTTLNDYAQKIPGFRPNITTPHFSRMAIRGLGSAMAGATSAGYQSETGFVVDNVPWIQPEYQAGDWTNIESFEISYGPSGTSGGKNTDVGTIYITTPLPSFARKTQLETSIGSYGHVIQKVDATGPVIDEALAYRVSGYYERARGWIRDAGNGQDYGDINRQGIRIQLLGVGENFTDRFIFSFNNIAEYTGYGQGAGGGSATAPIGDSFLVYANGTRPASTYFQTFANRLGKPIQTTNPYQPYLGHPGLDYARVGTISNELNYQLGQHTLTSITAFGYFNAPMYDCTDNQSAWIGAGTCNMDNYGMQVSQEVRLSSPKGEQFEWLAGLYTLYESNWARMHHTELGPYAAQWLNNPAAMQGLINWFNTGVRDTQVAGYASGTLHFTDKFSITAGVRNSYDMRYQTTTWVPQLVSGSPYSYAQQISALIAGGGGGNVTTGGHTNNHNGVTALLNPSLQVNDNILLYGLVGRGDKAPTANGTAGPVTPGNLANGFTPFFNKSTRSLDYEIGLKTNWFDDQFVSNVNFYWNDLWNFQTPQSLLYTTSAGILASTSYMGNAPHVRLRGVEFIERWAPNFIPGLQVHATGAYTEARYISYDQAPAPADYTYPGGPSTVSLSNTRMTGVPWWSFNVGVDYAHPVGQVFRELGEALHDTSAWTTTSYTAFGYGNVAWFNKSQLTNPRSVYQYWQPAYSLVNLGAGLRTDDRNYAVTFWVKNLFDARPFSAFTVGNATAPAAVSLTMQGPRYFGVTFSAAL